MDGFAFTGIESILEWMEQTGLLDAISDVIVEVSVESVISLIVLAVSAIASLAVGGIILAAVLIGLIVAAVVAVTLYVLRAIGLCKIAKKLGVKNRFLAWVPYGHAYVLGACAEKSAQRNGKKPWKWSWILLGTTLGLGIGMPIVQLAVSILLSIFPMLSVLVTMILECASLVLLAMIAHCLWSTCREFMDNTLAIVLAILAPLCDVVPLCLFIVGFLKPRAAQEPDAVAVVIPAEQEVPAE
ncbi:MAG: hypothetical protein J6V39_02020 [Clostridia bacterium]|nr:hypothetical protein [Clostridia bacterium]